MKKRIVVMFMTLVIVSSFLVGCGFGKKKDTPMTDKEDTQKDIFLIGSANYSFFADYIL